MGSKITHQMMWIFIFPSIVIDIIWTCMASGGATCAAIGAGNVFSDTLSSFPATVGNLHGIGVRAEHSNG